MNEQNYIDPYSYPGDEEVSLKEAAKIAVDKFLFLPEIVGVGVKADTIIFYVLNEKAKLVIPETIKGYNCAIQVTGENISL